MKSRLFIFLICFSLTVRILNAQDTLTIRKLIDRAVKFDPDKTDSLLYYANYIKKISVEIGYKYGEVSAQRLKGFYYEYTENFDSALIQFQLFNEKAVAYNLVSQQWHAIADVANVYLYTEQYTLAKESYFKCLRLAPRINATTFQLAHINNNIAGCYQYLADYDSAYFYYQIAIKLDEAGNDSLHLAERKSNISEVLMPMGRLEIAKKYLLESTAYNLSHNMIDALWYNYNNLGQLYLLQKNYSQSEFYYRLSYEQAQKTTTKNKLAQTLDGLSKLYQQMGDYAKALQSKIQADSISTQVINENTNKKIAELQEKYKAEKRQQENNLLTANLERQTLQKRNISIIALALTVIISVTFFALYTNTKKKNLLLKQNLLINRQKNKLTELNFEKNSLISIVSHDLSSPIVNIQLGCKLLSRQLNGDMEKAKTLKNIEQSADYGYNLIQNILTVENAETGNHKIVLEEIQLEKFVNELTDEFKEASSVKKIGIYSAVHPSSSLLLTDARLLKRIMENLVSNALKFSPVGKNIWLLANQDKESTSLTVKDEGPGITDEERKILFSKYGRLSNKPTNNERSIGLGLHIVKRIADELNAEIAVSSIPGMGAEFKVIFKS